MFLLLTFCDTEKTKIDNANIATHFNLHTPIFCFFNYSKIKSEIVEVLTTLGCTENISLLPSVLIIKINL